MFCHAIAVLPGGRQKTIANKNEQQILTEIVIPFVSTGIVEAKWGVRKQSYQVIDLRIYKTTKPWYKKGGVAFEQFVEGNRNVFSAFQKRAQSALGRRVHRVFVIMPIQGGKFGSQDEQRIFQEFDKRFELLERLLSDYDCVAIRIDREHPLEDLVNRIKDEISKANFLIADLTDERPSCYFEAGYAEALRKPIVYIASKESVLKPKTQTHIHFDIHMNVNYFTNHTEMAEKVKASIERNKEKLFKTQAETEILV